MITGDKRTLKAHMGAGKLMTIRLPESPRRVTLSINDRPIEVPEGTTILQAAQHAGISIPYFCYHPGLTPEGNCRMCLVEIEGLRKLEPSCTMPVRQGMKVHTESETIAEARRGVMEFLLLNHPLDCPWCDKAGECMLQDHSYDFGAGITRHDLLKRTYPVKDFSDRLKMYMNRCIHCTRCVRFLREVEGGEEFSLYQRGAYVDVGTYIEHNLSSNYQGCLADVCPVGALVTKPFLYRARVFDLEAQASVCPGCSAGCSIYVDRSRGRVARLRPRPNLQVNDWWMCDNGRFGWKWIEQNRLDAPYQSAEGAAEGEYVAIDWETALDSAAEALRGASERPGSLAGIAWGGSSCEELHLLARLIRGLSGDLAHWYGPQGRIDPGDKVDFLYRSDPHPNTRGLEAIVEPTLALQDLLGRIDAGQVTTLLVLGAPLTEETAARLAPCPQVIVLASHRTPAAGVATLALPGTVWLEKSGTFLNGDRHLQRFLQALEPPGQSRPDGAVLAHLLESVGLGGPFDEPESVFDDLAATIPLFAGLRWHELMPEGVRLGSPATGTSGPVPIPGEPA